MSEELQQYLDAGKLTAEHVSVLHYLQPGCYCTHRSWGFGKVAQWDLPENKILIDFEEKKAHPMQLAYAAETLTPLPVEHILVRIAEDPQKVRAEAEEDPVGLMASLLKDCGGKATLDHITSILVPKVFETAAFKKWFTAIKKKLNSDGHFVIPTKKALPIQFQEDKIEPHHRLLEAFRETRNPKEQVTYLNEALKLVHHFAEDRESLDQFLGELLQAAERAGNMHLSKATELLLGHQEIHAATKEEEEYNYQQLYELLVQVPERLYEIFEDIPAAKYRGLLKHFPNIFEEHWKKYLVFLLKGADPRLISEVYQLFKKEGEEEFFHRHLSQAIEERSISSDFLKWVCEQKEDLFSGLKNHELFHTILASLERDMHSEGKKGSRLYDLLLKDKELFAALLEEAEQEHARTVLRKLMMSPVFQDIDRRSLLGRLLNIHPDLTSMIEGEEDKEEEESSMPGNKLIVSWASLERRKGEYEHLISKLIPQNRKDISIARSYGDLRENFEFKSAKEQQTVLMRQKAELEAMLSQARGTNFENPETSVVSIGTVVTLKSDDDGHEEVFSILGAWDGNPERGWVSYQAGIGQVLLGKAPGSRVELPVEGGHKTMSIVAIEPFADVAQLS